jgi:hypothetical protein
VSCASAAACSAVGFYDNAGAAVTLAEHWDGTKWTIQTTLNPSGAQASLLIGASCRSVTACTAVGNYHDSGGSHLTLAEQSS